MVNLSVALVDNDQHVLHLLSVLILLTKLSTGFRVQGSNPEEHKERPQLYVLKAYITVYVPWSKGA